MDREHFPQAFTLFPCIKVFGWHDILFGTLLDFGISFRAVSL
jgi:hypothetical protein